MFDFCNISSIFAEDIAPHGHGPSSEPALKRFAVVLRWLAVGGTYASIGDAFGIEKSTVHKYVKLVINAMYTHTGIRGMMKFPQTEEEVTQAIHDFEHLSGLPQCCGAIDGSMVPINKPSEHDGDVFWCYKHNAPAILLLGIVDSTGRFMYVDVGRPGSVGDSAAFERSSLMQLLRNGTLLGAQHSRDVAGVKVKPYLVGDAAFALSSHVMKGYSVDDSCKKKVWNPQRQLAQVHNIFSTPKLAKRNFFSIQKVFAQNI